MDKPTPHYRTGEEAKAGDRVQCQGKKGVVICVGAQLADYGLDPEQHMEFIMIHYENWGPVCEPADGEDIDFLSHNES